MYYTRWFAGAASKENDRQHAKCLPLWASSPSIMGLLPAWGPFASVWPFSINIGPFTTDGALSPSLTPPLGGGVEWSAPALSHIIVTT